MTFKPHGLATGIGSLPFTDPELACRKVLDSFPEIPFWPQLPKKSFLENMYVQYSRNLAGVKIDQAARRIHIDTSEDLTNELAQGLEQALNKNYDYFNLTPEYASGFFAFLKLVAGVQDKIKFVKGHITGPISFGLSINDENGRAILYNAEYAEYLTQLIAAQAAWQVRELKKIAPVIMFLDEPSLVSIGSAFASLDRADVINRINNVTEVIHEEGALVAVHCCGNTDWSILTETSIDIINFDSFGYSDSLALYPNDINKFLSRGGILAWGAIPTEEAARNAKAEDLHKKLLGAIEVLSEKGVDKKLLIDQAIITPSCGMGTLPEDLAEKIINLTREVSKLYQ